MGVAPIWTTKSSNLICRHRQVRKGPYAEGTTCLLMCDVKMYFLRYPLTTPFSGTIWNIFKQWFQLLHRWFELLWWKYMSIGSVWGKTFEIMALKVSILSKIIIALLVRFYYYFGTAYDSSKKISVILISVNEWYLKWISRVILGICKKKKKEVEVFRIQLSHIQKSLNPLWFWQVESSR